jgi:hypothetical protein
MKKEDFHKDDFYDAYVLGRLSTEDEDLFEEHLLFCEHCRKEIEIREISVAGSTAGEDISQDGTMTRKLSRKVLIIRLSIAASLLIMAGYSLYIIINPSREKAIMEQGKSGEEIPTHPDATTDTSFFPESEIKSETVQDSEYLLAEAFRPYPMFENAIENQVRSSGFSVLAPVLSQVFTTSDSIEFQWKNGYYQLTLVIFNNKGKIIFESIAESPFTLEKKLPSGLYYWQLDTDDEALQTSKFIVQEEQ